MKTLFMVFSLLILTGCATTSQKTNLLSVGMTKQEVVQIMGTPKSTSAQNNTEFLLYDEYENQTQIYLDEPSEYFIKISNGKVVSYGRMGDFDSTKPDEQKIDLNINGL